MKLKNTKSIVMFIGLILTTTLLTTSLAKASDTPAGTKVHYVRADASGRGVVMFTADINNQAVCSDVGYERRMAFDANTAGGRALLALFTSAKLGNKDVLAYGSGGCSIYADVMEDLNYALMIN